MPVVTGEKYRLKKITQKAIARKAITLAGTLSESLNIRLPESSGTSVIFNIITGTAGITPQRYSITITGRFAKPKRTPTGMGRKFSITPKTTLIAPKRPTIAIL
jgi:hypothetical protein